MTLEDIQRSNPGFHDWTPVEIAGCDGATFTNGVTVFGIAWRGQRHVSAPWPWTEAQVERARNVLGSVREKV